MYKDIKIAIVEDDENLRFLIAHRLESEGYQVVQSGDGNTAIQLVEEHNPEILLLDWMLPGKQGSEICKELRENGYTGLVIMLTAKSQDIDKIDAYEFGVSDYITKPFSMDVLVAMVENKIKYFVNKTNTGLYTFGDTEHHPNIHSLVRAGKKIELTILENRILLYFLQNKGRVISRDELMQVVWGYSSNVNTRTLDMHIVRLRKKIEVNADKPYFLQTVRGMGYKFVEEQTEEATN